jgi:hypothetical protein
LRCCASYILGGCFRQVEAELARVLQRVQAEQSPFDDAAFAFRPDNAWATPAPFVDGWDEP